MKKSALLFIAMASVFSLSCLAQNADRFPDGALMEHMQLMSSDMSGNNDLAVVSYRVEERINMAFGSSITTYEVSNISLVGTNNLGENNTRVVTPKYGRAKAKAVTVNKELPAIMIAAAPSVTLPKLAPVVVDTRPKFVNIDILSTYERVLEKGYRTVEMLKRVANARYFENDLPVAAKWYTELFAMTNDLEPEYYFRYAQSLKSINQPEKANEMMKIFENKK